MSWVRAYAPKVVSGLAIAAVAGAAGWVSYSHIYDLTLTLHQAVMVARLMPFSVDGLIVIGSVVLLTEAGQPRLGWLGVGPGVAISLFANVESGIRYGVLAAVWAGIPAVAFSLATFLLERWLKAQTVPAAPVTAPAVSGGVPDEPETVPAGAPAAVSASAPASAPAEPGSAPAVPGAHSNGSGVHPGEVRPFADELARGEVPSLRRIRAELRVGQPKAQEIQARLSALARTP